MALLLALLAPALGGGTSPMAEGILLVGIGLAAAALPARQLRAGFLLCAGLLLVAALDFAWPAQLARLAWRARLEEAGFPLPWCCSPQPWVSLRAWLLLLGGVVWLGWCAGQAWTTRARLVVCEGLAVGIGGIAFVALLTRHVPVWPGGTGLGPFENRNQTALLFAAGAFLTVACGVERFRGCGKNSGPPVIAGLAWLCLLGVYTAALAINRSRSGPLLFAGMTVSWMLFVTPKWKRKPETLAVALATCLLLGTVFLLTGQGLITRLTANPVMDFRLKIFDDALGLIRASPWTGTGLGCFDAIFPLYRSASIIQQRVLHPESDWLWLAAETGLPGLLAALGLAAWMGAQVWRGLAVGADRAMRLALYVACLGILVHSFVDVPGHRLGTIMPALLLLGMAVGAQEKGKRWTVSVLRGSGLVVLALGGLLVLPFAAPLDWRLYFEKAQTEGAHGQLTESLGDFRRARFLEPNYAGLPFAEGIYWLDVAPRFAVEPWEEALRRTPRAGRPELYQNMLARAFPSHPEIHWALWSLASSDASMELTYFGWATPDEFKAQLDEILHEDPALRRYEPGQLRRLFPIWMNKGDAQRLEFLLARRPEWQKQWTPPGQR